MLAQNAKIVCKLFTIAIGLVFLFPSLYLFAVNNKIVKTKESTIIQKPIVFNKERIILTRQYRLEHYGIKSRSIKIKPLMVVLHWTATKNFKTAYDIFNRATLNNRPELKGGGNLNVSTHFLVGRDGKIYQLMPTNWMARHVIGLNNIAIGIENVGGENGKENLTSAQVSADIYLVKYLKKRYSSIRYLIGHYEYGKFRHTDLWKERDKNYFTKKVDPGKKFMYLVRSGLHGLFEKTSVHDPVNNSH